MFKKLIWKIKSFRCKERQTTTDGVVRCYGTHNPCEKCNCYKEK